MVNFINKEILTVDMTSVTLEQVNENINSLKKEVDELKDIIQISNREKLAKKARKAKKGEGKFVR